MIPDVEDSNDMENLHICVSSYEERWFAKTKIRRKNAEAKWIVDPGRKSLENEIWLIKYEL